MELTTNKAHDDSICGAKTRAGTPCKQRAGWGTNHVGEGRCKLHGGKSTGPRDKDKIKRNKNAVTTGERESIVFDYLEDDEKALLGQIELDKLKQINNEIKLIDIRLRRMMGRISKLQESELSVVEEVDSQTPMGDESSTRRQSNLSQIQNIEDAITRVQAQKLRLIESKHKLETDLKINVSTEDKLESYLNVLGGKIDEY